MIDLTRDDDINVNNAAHDARVTTNPHLVTNAAYRASYGNNAPINHTLVTNAAYDAMYGPNAGYDNRTASTSPASSSYTPNELPPAPRTPPSPWRAPGPPPPARAAPPAPRARADRADRDPQPLLEYIPETELGYMRSR